MKVSYAHFAKKFEEERNERDEVNLEVHSPNARLEPLIDISFGVIPFNVARQKVKTHD